MAASRPSGARRGPRGIGQRIARRANVRTVDDRGDGVSRAREVRLEIRNTFTTYYETIYDYVRPDLTSVVLYNYVVRYVVQKNINGKVQR